jgi:hypothetical protein
MRVTGQARQTMWQPSFILAPDLIERCEQNCDFLSLRILHPLFYRFKKIIGCEFELCFLG